MDAELRRAINDNQDEMTMEPILRKSTRSLRQNGLLKVVQGITSLDEVLRVTTTGQGDDE